MKYKLICSDLDDTLLNSDGQIPKGLKDAVKRYESAGGKFCIATGRMTVGTKFVCEELELKGEIITYQGVIVSDIESGKVISSDSINWNDAAEIAEYIESKGVYLQTYDGEEFIVEKATEYADLYGKISQANYRVVGGKLSSYIKRIGLNPPKLLIIEEPERVPARLKELKDCFGEKFLINTSKPFIIEIIPKNINKAVAVENLAKRHGIKREEIICVGDSANDLPMIDYAGLGIAVGNAKDSIKAHANVVAPSCDDDGLIWVIENYGFIN